MAQFGQLEHRHRKPYRPTETRFYGVCVYEEKVAVAEELRCSFLVLRIRMLTLSAFNVSPQDLSAITLEG